MKKIIILNLILWLISPLSFASPTSEQTNSKDSLYITLEAKVTELVHKDFNKEKAQYLEKTFNSKLQTLNIIIMIVSVMLTLAAFILTIIGARNLKRIKKNTKKLHQLEEEADKIMIELRDRYNESIKRDNEMRDQIANEIDKNNISNILSKLYHKSQIKPQETLKDIYKYEKLNISDPDLYFLKAELLYDRKEYKEALLAYKKAFKLNSSDLDSVYDICELAIMCNSKEDFDTYYLHLLQNKEQVSTIGFKLLEAFSIYKFYPESLANKIQNFKNQIESNPNNSTHEIDYTDIKYFLNNEVDTAELETLNKFVTWLNTSYPQN